MQYVCVGDDAAQRHPDDLAVISLSGLLLNVNELEPTRRSGRWDAAEVVGKEKCLYMFDQTAAARRKRILDSSSARRPLPKTLSFAPRRDISGTERLNKTRFQSSLRRHVDVRWAN